MIISFAWTIEALLTGKKTVTRRNWNDNYAKKFHLDDLVDAYNKSPRHGGVKVAVIKITKEPYKQILRDMPDSHFYREGGALYWSNKREFTEFMGGEQKTYWVIEFELR